MCVNVVLSDYVGIKYYTRIVIGLMVLVKFFWLMDYNNAYILLINR